MPTCTHSWTRGPAKCTRAHPAHVLISHCACAVLAISVLPLERLLPVLAEVTAASRVIIMYALVAKIGKPLVPAR